MVSILGIHTDGVKPVFIDNRALKDPVISLEDDGIAEDQGQRLVLDPNLGWLVDGERKP